MLAVERGGGSGEVPAEPRRLVLQLGKANAMAPSTDGLLKDSPAPT